MNGFPVISVHSAPRIGRKIGTKLIGITTHHPAWELAEEFSISETSLKNYFRGVYGQNISVYLREIRMNKAGELLATTRLSVAEIAEQVSYLNQSKFASVFKKQFGVSPLEYRRSRHLEKKWPGNRAPWSAIRSHISSDRLCHRSPLPHLLQEASPVSFLHQMQRLLPVLPSHLLRENTGYAPGPIFVQGISNCS